MNDNWAHHVNEKFCEEIRLATSAPVERCIELEQENAELRTQLAKCVEFIGNEFDNHKSSFTQIRMKRLDFIESLPATAKHDAEILRCAEYAVSDDCVDFTEAYEYLARAVRAREGAR